MSKQRPSKSKCARAIALMLAGAVLLLAVGAFLAGVIVRSEDHPRMTTIDPHSTLQPVATQSAPATTLPAPSSTMAPELPPIEDAPSLPAETPDSSENPIPPSSAPPQPSWGVPEPTGPKTLFCVGINPHQTCWNI